jgi:hypothetical protein
LRPRSSPHRGYTSSARQTLLLQAARAGSGVARSRDARSRSGWPAQSLRTPLQNQPRAKLGLSASARSTSPIIAPISSPRAASTKAALASARVVLPRLERLPGKIAGFAAGYLRHFGPALSDEPPVASRRPGQCRAVMPIDRDRLLEQSQGLSPRAGDPRATLPKARARRRERIVRIGKMAGNSPQTEKPWGPEVASPSAPPAAGKRPV